MLFFLPPLLCAGCKLVGFPRGREWSLSLRSVAGFCRFQVQELKESLAEILGTAAEAGDEGAGRSEPLGAAELGGGVGVVRGGGAAAVVVIFGCWLYVVGWCCFQTEDWLSPSS